jgi:hypothetical protein
MAKLTYPTDSTGLMIRAGDVVAYNKSGVVVKGRVVSYKPRTDSIARNNSNDNSVQWIVEIMGSGTSGNGVSEVKNTDGILVIG